MTALTGPAWTEAEIRAAARGTLHPVDTDSLLHTLASGRAFAVSLAACDEMRAASRAMTAAHEADDRAAWLRATERFEAATERHRVAMAECDALHEARMAALRGDR